MIIRNHRFGPNPWMGLALMLTLVPAMTMASGAHTPGSWSLQFQITDNLSLAKFDGATISVKRHFSDKSAWRLGARLSGQAIDGEERSESPGGMQVRTTENNSWSTQFALLYMRYRNPAAVTSLMWGVGPVVGYSKSTNTSTIPPRSVGVNERRTWELGARTLIGFEYLPVEWLAVHTEYRFDVLYADSDSDQESRIDENISTTTRDQSSWTMGSGRVLFGASVYF